MTIEEAVRILDPETTREALFGLEKAEAIPLVEEACRLACVALRRYKPVKKPRLPEDSLLSGHIWRAKER